MSEESDYGKFREYSKLTEQQKSIIDSIVVIRKRNLNNTAPIWDKYCEYANNARSTFLNDTLLFSNTTRCICLLDSIFTSSKADMLKLKFTSKSPDDLSLIQDVVISNTTTDWCNNVNIKEHEINISNINYINNSLKEAELLISDNQIGTPLLKMPFGADLYTVDTLCAIDLLSNIKNKYKGKALFIDLWATWCGPCLREMPVSNSLHNEFNDVPVEFIYLCTSEGSSIEKWKSKISELEISGTHLFVNSIIHSELMSLFSVSGFPSYVFIDSDGNFIPGAISKPSTIDKNKLKKLIDE
jgi:thiol-disulfide isomerase/thioredoxin